MDDVLNGLLDALINGGGSTDAIAESLKFKADMMSIVNSIWGYFVIFGIGMTLVYFLMEMNNRYALDGRDMNFKTFFAPFLKLMIAIAVLSQGARIVGWLMDFHNDFIDYSLDHFKFSTEEVTSGTNVLSANLSTTKGFLDGLAFFGKVIMIFPLMFMWIVNLILSLVWQYKAISFKIEYLFRVAVTPIALSDVYSGQNANAIRWLKGFIALSLYGMAFIVIPRIGGTLAITGLANPSSIWESIKSLCEMILIIPIAELGVLSAIKQLTKEVMG